MPGSLTGGFVWSRRRGKLSRRSRHMRNPQFYVSGKRAMHTFKRNTLNDDRLQTTWWCFVCQTYFLPVPYRLRCAITWRPLSPFQILWYFFPVRIYLLYLTGYCLLMYFQIKIIWPVNSMNVLITTGPQAFTWTNDDLLPAVCMHNQTWIWTDTGSKTYLWYTTQIN